MSYWIDEFGHEFVLQADETKECIKCRAWKFLYDDARIHTGTFIGDDSGATLTCDELVVKRVLES